MLGREGERARGGGERERCLREKDVGGGGERERETEREIGERERDV